jgi:hypothetical protein
MLLIMALAYPHVFVSTERLAVNIAIAPHTPGDRLPNVVMPVTRSNCMGKFVQNNVVKRRISHKLAGNKVFG